MQRREFIKAMGAAGCCLPGISRLAWAKDGSPRPLLTVVFLRGGADGLHMVGPAADPDYVAARPPELRVLESSERGGERPGLPLDNSLAPAAGFHLHSEAGALHELYRAGRLAIIHAVGLTDGTRSHFVAQDLMERGLADEKRILHTEKGWLAQATPGLGGMVPVYSATSSPVSALRGSSGVLALPDSAAGLLPPWGAPTAALLRRMSAPGQDPAQLATMQALEILENLDKHIPKDGKGRPLAYAAAGKANYEGAGDLARSLGAVARLARMDVGLACACVDFGGWDTHEGQAGRFANQMRQLSIGLAAFHADLAAAGRRQITLVMTEFGRRLRANKSGGTDHGHGACWLTLGDSVQGGRMYGSWPGLTTPKLDQGVDLAVSTDYRQVLSEILQGLLLTPGDGLAGWKGRSALGLLG